MVGGNRRCSASLRNSSGKRSRRLRFVLEWNAMKETMLDIAKRVDAFFMEKSPIHETMRRLAEALKDMKISFAIAGAMAANAHGHKRTTADVDVLMRREDLNRFKERWLGLGWVDKFEGSKGFKDARNNINVDVLIVGDFPGDGLPKPVAFPEPESVLEFRDDSMPYISLATLIEMKLASGMTAPHRPRDLDDVIQLIRANKLSRAYIDTINPYVHDKFLEMWQAAQVEEDY